jgi:hypothetical protein
MKKNDYCVKIIEIHGTRTATIQEVESVKKGVIRLVDYSITYDAETYDELDSAMPMVRSYLVEFDEGEVKNWRLKDA